MGLKLIKINIGKFGLHFISDTYYLSGEVNFLKELFVMVLTPAVPFTSLQTEKAQGVLEFLSFVKRLGKMEIIKMDRVRNTHPIFTRVPLNLFAAKEVYTVHLSLDEGVILHSPIYGWLAPSVTPWVKELVELFLSSAENHQRVMYYAWLEH